MNDIIKKNMPNGNGHSWNGLSKNTNMSIGLAITILAGVVLAYGMLTSVQSGQAALQNQVERIERTYVPRQEIESELKNINSKLDLILKEEYGRQTQ